MAISKILCIKEGTTGTPGKHLKIAIDYISKPEKTNGGSLIGTLNCQKDFVFDQMRDTKVKFDKYSKRQAYHLIISFNEGEVDEDTAFMAVSEFASKYLGDKYEAVYAIHNNTAHIHGHIIWNSVNRIDGRKYRYKKGDWERIIQPLVNEICEKYGLESLDIDNRAEKLHEWNERKDGPFVWSSMIRRDFDSCIIMASDFDTFLELLETKGYEIKIGKYLAVKPIGMQRFRRSKTLGEDYTLERIAERIITENVNTKKEPRTPKIVYCKVKGNVRAIKRKKLTPFQKRYYARLYRLGKIKKRPYSIYYKYKDDIKKMKELQKECIYLARHHVSNVDDLKEAINVDEERLQEVILDRRKLNNKRKSFNDVFKIYKEMSKLYDAHSFFFSGDITFEEEEIKWNALNQKLESQGYSYDEVKRLHEYYDLELQSIKERQKKIKEQIKIANGILADQERDISKEIPKELPVKQNVGTKQHDEKKKSR